MELADNASKFKDSKSKESDRAGQKQSLLADTEAFRSMKEHIIPLSDLCNQLETDINRGLTQEHAQTKLKLIGPNRLTEKKPTPWYILFLKTLLGWFSILLWIGSFLCFVAYGIAPSSPTNMYLGIVLAGIILLTACFTFYQEAKSSAIMAGFKNMIPPITMALRDGREVQLESSVLVPGDIVLLKAGAKIPADVRIVESNNFKVDNSSLTGESEPQDRKVECTNEKSPLETKNLAFFGTTGAQGDGRGIVINTGDRTVIGCIAKLANSAESQETTLGKEISRFVKFIGAISILSGVSLFILGIGLGYPMVINIIYAVGIIVANVPEGLLIAVTVSLTITAKRMADKHVLVKNLQSVETLGSATCICSDKTGTLTENKMTIVGLWYDILGREVINYERREDVENLGYSTKDPTFKMLQYCATLNNKTKWNLEPEKKLLEDKNGTPFSQEKAQQIISEYKENLQASSIKTWPVMGGDASEAAMIKFFHPISDIESMRESYPILVRNDIKGEIPFTSANKYAVTIHEPVDFAPSENSRDCLLLMKGAPEQIWQRCTKIFLNGQEVPISQAHKEEFHKANKIYGGQGRRVLGFAMYWLPHSIYDEDYIFQANLKEGPNFPLIGLTFIGLAALEDPPKLRVKEAVESCHTAGIKVVMVTGDQPLTAAAIARQVSIITVAKTVNEIAEEKGIPFFSNLDESDAVVVHGEELSKFVEEDKYLPFEEQRLCLFLHKKEVVFARTSPAQKFMIVDCAQKMGHIVAVTGDGVNDSPAIKKADIGIAMAIVGSDVAKDAADMLLMDDNFASIVDGVEEGRKIFDNLGKCICYALSANIPELTPFLALVIFQIPVPLSPVLMLLLSLGTDMWPAISLSYEYPELDIMFRKPRDAKVDHLVQAQLIRFSYMMMGVFQSMSGFMAYFVVMKDYGFSPQILWYLAQSTEGTQPKITDVYDPESIYNGNTNVGNSQYDGAQVDWGGGTEDGGYDLRIWYWRHKNWPTCTYPDDRSIVSNYRVCYGTEALAYAQYGFFLSVVVIQWANVMCVRTKRVSLFHHGVRNRVSLHGIAFETTLSVFVAFCPGVNFGFGGRHLHFLHFFVPGLPFYIYVMIYDELRKFAIRYQHEKNKGTNKVGWFERNTLY